MLTNQYISKNDINKVSGYFRYEWNEINSVDKIKCKATGHWHEIFSSWNWWFHRKLWVKAWTLCLSICYIEWKWDFTVDCTSACSEWFRHRASIQWSSLINAEARLALGPQSQQNIHTRASEPNGPRYSMGLIVRRPVHMIIYTPSVRHGRYCRQMERMINTERRRWQGKRRKGRSVCQCVWTVHTCAERTVPERSQSEAFSCKPGALLLWIRQFQPDGRPAFFMHTDDPSVSQLFWY